MALRFLAIACLLSAVGASGCTTLKTGLLSQPAAAPTATYVLRVDSGLLGPRTKTLPLREGMTIQNVLEDSGQLSLHRDFRIDIMRKADENNGIIKLPVQFDASKHRVRYETDYAIHPDDHIVIKPRTPSTLENITKWLGPQ